MNNIIVFFDYNCPFCYITLNILEDLKKSYDFNCIYKPCELYTCIPSDGILKEELMVGYDVENIYRKLRILGKRNNIEFGKLEKKYNSHMSLLLCEYAQQNNKIVDFSKELFMQYYINDMDISNLNVLKDICFNTCIDFEKAMYEINNNTLLENKLAEYNNLKEELNVELFPTYIINNDIRLSGILTKRAFIKAFENLN